MEMPIPGSFWLRPIVGVKLNLNSKDAPKKIFDVIKNFDRQCVIKTFTKFYEELKINLSLK